MRRYLPCALYAATLTLGCNGALVTPNADADDNDAAGPDIPDAGVDERPSDVAADLAHADAAACGCTLSSDRLTLTMSWDCLCATYGCTAGRLACADDRVSYPSCGLEADTTNTIGGPWVRVYDETGALVGEQYASDTDNYVCPSDRSLMAPRVRAGRFPDPSCTPVPCTCADGATVCATPVDGGPADAGRDADVGTVDAGSDAPTSCSGTPVTCDTGTPGGICSDSDFEQATCVNGQWKCRGTKIPVSQCACFGICPGGAG